MCIEILVIKNDEQITCETVGELAAALGRPFAEVSADHEDDDCLCNAYLTALKARTATKAEGWPWPEYVIELLANSKPDGG